RLARKKKTNQRRHHLTATLAGTTGKCSSQRLQASQRAGKREDGIAKVLQQINGGGVPEGKPTNVGKSTVTGKPTGKPAANTMAGKPADKHAERSKKCLRK